MYLTRRNDQYYIRVRIPSDIQNYFPVTEFKRTLHTDLYKKAKRLAASYRGKLEEVFTLIRSKTLTNDAIDKIVIDLIDWQVGNFDKGRNRETVSSDPELQYENEDYHRLLDASLEESASNLDLETAKYEAKIVEYRRVLALNQAVSFPPAVAWANVSLSTLGIDIDPTSPAYRKLCTEALKGMIKASSVRLAHLQGNFDTDYDKELRARPVSAMLSEVLDMRSENCTATMSDTINKVVDCLEAETGRNDIPLSDLSFPLIDRIADRLAHYPLRRFQHYPGIPLDEIHKLPHVQYCKASTSKADVKRFKEILSSAENFTGYGKYNTKKLTKKAALKETSTDKKREHFYPEDLVKILAELRRRKDKGEFRKNPHLLLIPLIALFQGMRQNEICQLRVSDIKENGGIWCISINEDPDGDEPSGKRVKAKNSFRTMPVHPALIELGLIRFWEKQRNKRCIRLWEGEAKVSCALNVKYGKHNKLYGQWFNREIRDKVRLEFSRRDKQCFHSFRHTFSGWYRANLLNYDRAAVVVLTGHLDKEDKAFLLTDTELYKNYDHRDALHIQRLYDTLKLLDYQLDLSGLAI